MRAALAIRDAMAEMNEQEPDIDLHVRVGVNTGEALVSLGASPLHGEGMAAGDVVNTAARLQTSAPVDGIVVGETTYRATERAIEYRDAPRRSRRRARRSPWPPGRCVEARSRYGIDITRRVDTTLVGESASSRSFGTRSIGRDIRTSHSSSPWSASRGSGRAAWCTSSSSHIEGMPDLIAWRQGRCLPYGDGVSYWALGEMVKAEAGILETDPDGEAADKLDRSGRRS